MPNGYRYYIIYLYSTGGACSLNVIQQLQNIWQFIVNIITWLVTSVTQAIEMIKAAGTAVTFLGSSMVNMPLFFKMAINLILWVIIIRFAASLLGLGGSND